MWRPHVQCGEQGTEANRKRTYDPDQQPAPHPVHPLEDARLAAVQSGDVGAHLTAERRKVGARVAPECREVGAQVGKIGTQRCEV